MGSIMSINYHSPATWDSLWSVPYHQQTLWSHTSLPCQWGLGHQPFHPLQLVEKNSERKYLISWAMKFQNFQAFEEKITHQKKLNIMKVNWHYGFTRFTIMEVFTQSNLKANEKYNTFILTENLCLPYPTSIFQYKI